jgi:hypothetical protein
MGCNHVGFSTIVTEVSLLCFGALKRAAFTPLVYLRWRQVVAPKRTLGFRLRYAGSWPAPSRSLVVLAAVTVRHAACCGLGALSAAWPAANSM